MIQIVRWSPLGSESQLIKYGTKGASKGGWGEEEGWKVEWDKVSNTDVR